MTESRRRSPARTLLALISMLSLLGALAMSASPVFAADQCEDHEGNAGKIQESDGSTTEEGVEISWGGDPGSITFENTNDVETATVVWCAKGGNDFAGPGNKALSTQTSVLLPGETDVAGPYGTAVSYFLLYSVTLTTLTDDGEPDTEVDKVASVSQVTNGDQYSYTITVTNEGDATAEDVHVWDNLANRLDVLSVTPSQGSCDPIASGNLLDCWLGDLAPGATATVVIEVDTDRTDCQTVYNRAYAQAANEAESDRSARVEVTIACGYTASLNILKVDEEGAPLADAVFEVEGLDGTFTTGEDGKACITGLLQDSVWVVMEIQAPPGFEIADPAWQEVDVDDDGDCDSPDAVFVNTEAEEEEEQTPTPTPTPTPTEGESESAAPSESESAASPPATGNVLPGNPTPSLGGGGTLPDTAVTEPIAAAPVAGLLALLMLGGLAGLGTRAVAEARRRR